MRSWVAKVRSICVDKELLFFGRPVHWKRIAYRLITVVVPPPSITPIPTCSASSNSFNIWSFCTRPARGQRRIAAAASVSPTPGPSPDKVTITSTTLVIPVPRTQEGARQRAESTAEELSLRKSVRAKKFKRPTQGRTIMSSVPLPRILKKKHFRVKHQKVKLFRANEPLVSVFMWGINHTVSKCMARFRVWFSISIWQSFGE